MDDDGECRNALRMGLKRAGLHWVRAGYEVVAGLGAFLDEVARARSGDAADGDREGPDEGPTRIEID